MTCAPVGASVEANPPVPNDVSKKPSAPERINFVVAPLSNAINNLSLPYA